MEKWLVLAVVFEELTLGHLSLPPPRQPPPPRPPRMAITLVDHELNNKAQKEKTKEQAWGGRVHSPLLVLLFDQVIKGCS